MARGRFDLPLDQTAANRVLPWLIGGLIYLTVVALGVAVVADHAARSYDRRAELVTVTLPLAEGGDSSRELAGALDVLDRAPGVLAATPVTSAELRALVKPWLGEAQVGVDLPLPRLIDVTLDPLLRPDLPALQDALREVVAGATIGIQASGPDRAERTAAFVRGWGGGVAVVGLLAALVAIGATTGLSMRLNRDAVELLRCMGASNGYLAGQFERHALFGGLPGGASGFGLALLTMAALLYSSRQMGIAGQVELGLRPLDWALLACVPVIGMLLAVAVVRITVLWRLEHPC